MNPNFEAFLTLLETTDLPRGRLNLYSDDTRCFCALGLCANVLMGIPTHELVFAAANDELYARIATFLGVTDSYLVYKVNDDLTYTTFKDVAQALRTNLPV
jgi:hypothetical protein